MTITLCLDKPNSATRRSLADISLSVAKSKKILVVTGAGISCSSGIPDFRSADGLYNLVKEQYPDTFLKGRDLFDASLFRDPASTSIFYSFISALKSSVDNASPTPTHRFIKTLDTKKKLLRSYTQNIDGLEERAGLTGSSSERAKGKGKLIAKEVRNVQLHGDIHRVRCIACSAEFACLEEHTRVFKEGRAPDCPECASRCKARVARSARPLRVGTLRPAIVLYDEPHPLGDDIGTIQSADVSRKPDLLIIMGTSLKVHGLKKLVKEFAKVVHSFTTTTKTKTWAGKVIFVNRTPPTSEWEGIIDYHVEGHTDTWVEKVLADWKKMRPVDWEVQQTLDGENGTLVAMKNLKIKLPAGKKKKGPDSENSRRGRQQSSTRPSSPEDPSSMAFSPRPPTSPSKRRCSSHGAEGSPHKKRSPERGEHPEISPLQLLNDNTNRFEEMELDEGPEIIEEPKKPKTASLSRQNSFKQSQDSKMNMLRRTRSMSRAEGLHKMVNVLKRTK